MLLSFKITDVYIILLIFLKITKGTSQLNPSPSVSQATTTSKSSTVPVGSTATNVETTAHVKNSSPSASQATTTKKLPTVPVGSTTTTVLTTTQVNNSSPFVSQATTTSNFSTVPFGSTATTVVTSTSATPTVTYDDHDTMHINLTHPLDRESKMIGLLLSEGVRIEVDMESGQIDVYLSFCAQLQPRIMVIENISAHHSSIVVLSADRLTQIYTATRCQRKSKLVLPAAEEPQDMYIITVADDPSSRGELEVEYTDVFGNNIKAKITGFPWYGIVAIVAVIIVAIGIAAGIYVRLKNK